MPFNPPIIRLELDHMKHTMLTALSEYHQEVSDAVEAQLQNAVETFPFEQVVLNAANDAITSAIESYFKCGDGYVVIHDAVSQALKQTFAKLESNE